MPSGAIEEEDGMGAGSDHLGDLLQRHLHGSRIAKGQNPSCAHPALGADGAEEMGPLGVLVMGRGGPRSPP